MATSTETSERTYERIVREHKLTREQGIIFKHYVWERFAAYTWSHADGPNGEEFYINMTNEASHGAYLLWEAAHDMFGLDLREIYESLTMGEIRDIVHRG